VTNTRSHHHRFHWCLQYKQPRLLYAPNITPNLWNTKTFPDGISPIHV
jgi:hypothetical protein